MLNKNSGPVIVITKDLLDETYFKIVDHMIDGNIIKPSSKLLIESFLNAYSVLMEYVDKDNVYIRAFSAFNMLIGKSNPDFKKNTLIKLSKPTMYKRIAMLKEKDFIVELPKELIPEFYTGQKGFTFYKLQFPTIKTKDVISAADSPENQRSAKYRKAIKAEMEFNSQMPFAYADQQLQKMGTHESLSNFLNRCIRPDTSNHQKTINNEFKVPVPNEKLTGLLKVTTTTLDTSEILIADDMVLVDYILSVILERLEDSEGLILPIENRFRFDFASILVDFKINDSGGYRDLLNRQFERIFSTDFKIVACPRTIWLMEKLGFVDSEGKPYDTVSIRLLSPIGQRNQDVPEGVDTILNNRKVNRYIDLSLPDHLIQQINKALENGDRRLVPMFSRDKILIQQSQPGLPWMLNNFLNQKCPRPGFKYGAVALKSFCSEWIKAWENKAESTKGTTTILKMLLSQDRLLYVEGLKQNSRNQPRIKLLYAKIDSYLIRIENKTPDGKQLGSLVYTFTAVKFTEAENREAEERSFLVRNHYLYSEDEIYKTIGKNIVARADITAKQYKYPAK